MRTWIMAAAALALAACGQAGTGPELPESNASGANAPSTPQSSSAPQANLSADDRRQLEELISAYLDDYVGQMAQGMVPAPGFSDEIAPMQPGTDHRWQVNLVANTPYRIIGACDNECTNLDMELIDSSGSVVESDLLDDDFPLVNFTPSANGTYYVRLIMQTCTIAPCYAGARVMTN